MINEDHQTEKKTSWPTSKIIRLDSPHIDERGSIQSLVNVKTNNVSIISSRADTVRSNHYHLKDWHYMYVLSGIFDYYFRATNSNEPLSCIKVQKGDMIFTPPLEDHATVFKTDCVLLAISGYPRDQINYEKDVRRIKLIDPKTLDILVSH